MKPPPFWLFLSACILAFACAGFAIFTTDFSTNPPMEIVLKKLIGAGIFLFLAILMQVLTLLSSADFNTIVFVVGAVGVVGLFVWGLSCDNEKKAERIFNAAWGVSGFLAGITIGGRKAEVQQQRSNGKAKSPRTNPPQTSSQ